MTSLLNCFELGNDWREELEQFNNWRAVAKVDKIESKRERAEIEQACEKLCGI